MSDLVVISTSDSDAAFYPDDVKSVHRTGNELTVVLESSSEVFEMSFASDSECKAAFDTIVEKIQNSWVTWLWLIICFGSTMLMADSIFQVDLSDKRLIITFKHRMDEGYDCEFKTPELAKQAFQQIVSKVK